MQNTEIQIGPEFFSGNTLDVARGLLGKKILYRACGGIIVETEAYRDDPASHFIRRPRQANILKETFGYIYIFLIYGIHYCLNFTTERDGVGAVLIRALEPTTGIELMRRRRKTQSLLDLTNGPGKLCQALGINKNLSGQPVGDRLKIYDEIDTPPVRQARRIGISKARELEWRFFIPHNPFVSRK